MSWKKASDKSTCQLARKNPACLDVTFPFRSFSLLHKEVNFSNGDAGVLRCNSWICPCKTGARVLAWFLNNQFWSPSGYLWIRTASCPVLRQEFRASSSWSVGLDILDRGSPFKQDPTKTREMISTSKVQTSKNCGKKLPTKSYQGIGCFNQ